MCPGTAARALRVSLIMFLLLSSSASGRRAGGKAGGTGRRPAGPPSRAGASAEPRRGRQVPVPAGAPGPEGPAESVSRSCAVYVYVCVCMSVGLSVFVLGGGRFVCKLPRTFKSLNCGLKHFKEKEHLAACGGMVGGGFLRA